MKTYDDMTPEKSKTIRKIDIRDLSYHEVKEYVSLVKEKSYRAKQIYEWLHEKNVDSFDKMKNVSVELIKLLQSRFYLYIPKIINQQKSQDGTLKLLFELVDGQRIETVYIPTKTRLTVCVSTQVGCKFGCRFCASGIGGFIRNLECSEILNQVLFAGKLYDDRKVTNIVFMGVGEPLDNYDNLMKSIRILNDKKALNIGARRITVSTCGVIPKIKALAKEGLQIELAISLHGYDNESRNILMPVNKKYPFNDLVEASRAYYNQTKRQITFEYVLIKDITCTKEAIRSFKKFLVGFDCKINLIPYNAVKDFKYQPPSKEEIFSFQKSLAQNGIKSTIRNSRGNDVSASCGQLKHQTK